MADLDLGELERLIAAASPRPWRIEPLLRDYLAGAVDGENRNVADMRRADAWLVVALANAAPALIAAARERDRLREAIRIGGALLRLERAVLGVPGGIDPEAEGLRALCREAADALGAIDSALECECVCDCASDEQEQEHEPECERCAACTFDNVLPARLRARLRAAGGGT